MSIEEEARAEAKKRWPESDGYGGALWQNVASRRDFVAGALWQATHEPSKAECVDIANRAQAETGRSIWPSTVRAVLSAARQVGTQPTEGGQR
ncbi:hypothetical protein [Microbacterium sp. KR10-403]|uniref:hypothetical protein n=1 Tax=Microbacterium sp. KR10-403 TaxID=3158581 RepID=UPI0032E47F69